MRLKHLLLNLLPKKVRQTAFRRYLRVPVSSPPELRIKIAETDEEHQAAYSIIHESYLEKGYTKPQTHQLRIIKYFALPTTVTIVAYWKDEIVGTVSIIQDSVMGVPADSEFDLKPLRRSRLRFCEISSLAIKKKHRSQHSIMMLLFHYYYYFARNYLHLDSAIMTVNPTAVDLYQSLFFFEELEGHKVSNYDFVNGAPAVGLFHLFNRLNFNFNKHFSGRRAEQNLFDFFLNREFDCHEFPDATYHHSNFGTLSPEDLQRYFSEMSDVYFKMTEQEKLHLWRSYPIKRFKLGLPDLEKRKKEHVRILETRFTTSLKCWVSETGSPAVVIAQLINISESGLRLKTEHSVPNISTVYVEIGPGKLCRLEAQKAWSHQMDQDYGFKIVRAGTMWKNYCTFLNNQFLASSGKRPKAKLKLVS